MPQDRHLVLNLEWPHDWSTFQDGRQFVAQGPNDQEVIISRSFVSGEGSKEERDSITESTRAAMLMAMTRAASHPELTAPARTQFEIQDDVTLHCMSSKTHDGEITFEQFALFSDRESILLTYEAPTTESESLEWVTSAVRDVHVDGDTA